ncbi:MAG: discoidin domain-containing protein [Proteiniphilum sp.]
MKRILYSLSVFSVLFSLLCCSGQYDDIKEHTSSEKVYPGKYDTVSIQVGIERVEIDLLKAGRIPASEIRLGKAKKTLVEWDNESLVIDSVCSWVNIEGLSRSKLYRFKIYTLDEYENKSIPVETSAIPYFLSDLERLTVPDPRVVNTSAGVQVGWPKELLSVMMDHYGMNYRYTDRDGIVHEGEEGPNASLLIENVATGDEVTIDLVHRIVPKINEKPILDTVEIVQQVTMIVPQLSVRVNVGRDKPTKVSDYRNSGEDGSKVVDGVKAGGGRWVTNGGDHWLEIDLGAGYPIDGFQMWTGNGSQYTQALANFEFQALVLGSWVTLDAQTANANPSYFANFSTATTTSKVRLNIKNQEVRLFEIEVYVTVTKPELRVNVALQRDTRWSDSRNNNTEGGDKAVDGSKASNSTRWVTANSAISPHWLEIDFVGPVAIDGFQMWTGADAPAYKQPFANFTFSAWDVEQNKWASVVARTGNTDPTLAVNFSPVTTTKVRLEVFGQDVRLFELEVYSTITLFE